MIMNKNGRKPVLRSQCWGAKGEERRTVEQGESVLASSLVIQSNKYQWDSRCSLLCRGLPRRKVVFTGKPSQR